MAGARLSLRIGDGNPVPVGFLRCKSSTGTACPRINSNRNQSLSIIAWIQSGGLVNIAHLEEWTGALGTIRRHQAERSLFSTTISRNAQTESSHFRRAWRNAKATADT